MTLEKLLIFGVGLGVVAALAVSAKTVSDNRGPQHNTYKENVIELIEVK